MARQKNDGTYRSGEVEEEWDGSGSKWGGGGYEQQQQ